MVLASDPVIVCGAKYIDWRTFYRGLEFQDEDERSVFIGKYWMRRRFRYPLPPEISESWNDMITTWDQVPRPTSYNKVIKRTLRQDKPWSVNSYFRKHVQPFLNAMMNSIYFMALVLILAPMTISLASLLPRDGDMPDGLLKVFLAHAVSYITAFSSGLILTILLMMAKPKELPLLRYLEPVDIYDDKIVPIVKVLRILRVRQANDPRDRSFAIHGILRRLGFVLPTPDYSKSLGQIYFQLFKTLLKQDPYLINLIIYSSITDLDAPSWVPDWSTIDISSWLPSNYIYEPIEGPNRGEVPNLRITEETLEVFGLWRGDVVFYYSPPSRMASLRESHDQKDTFVELCTFVSDFSKFVIAIKHAGLSDTRMLQPMRNALLAHRTNFEDRGADANKDLYNLFDKWWHAMSVDLRGFEEGRDNLEADVCNFLKHDSETRDFLLQCYQSLGGKRALFFAQPDIIGSGPCNLIEGDRIASVEGVSVPLILRRTAGDSERYKVVGPAFAHHLMKWGVRDKYIPSGRADIDSYEWPMILVPNPYGQRAMRQSTDFIWIMLA